jgi:hypothetical protein
VCCEMFFEQAYRLLERVAQKTFPLQLNMCPEMDSKLEHILSIDVIRKNPPRIHVEHRSRARCSAVGPPVAKTTDQAFRFDKLLDGVK